MSLPPELIASPGFRSGSTSHQRDDDGTRSDGSSSQVRFYQEDPPRRGDVVIDDELDFDVAAGGAFGKPSPLLASVLDDVDIANYAEYDSDDDDDDVANDQVSQQRAAVFFSSNNKNHSQSSRKKKQQQTNDAEQQQQQEAEDVGQQHDIEEEEEDETEFFAVPEQELVIPQLQRWIMVTEDDNNAEADRRSSTNASEVAGRSQSRTAESNSSNIFSLFGSRMRSASAAGAAPAASSVSGVDAASSSKPPLASSINQRTRFRGVQQRKDDMMDLLAQLSDTCEKNSQLHHREEKRRREQEQQQNQSPTAASRRKQQKKRAIIESLREYYGL